MEEDSKYLPAFVTPFGQYEFNLVPFGLTNAPRTFQRFMDTVLSNTNDTAAVYLHDVLLHAKTVEEALNNSRSVLVIFRGQGLTLNLKKCRFLVTYVTYLGFEIENGTVQPGTDKTKAIEGFLPPRNVHQVRQFLGLTGFFGQFVKEYAAIAKPLTDCYEKAFHGDEAKGGEFFS